MFLSLSKPFTTAWLSVSELCLLVFGIVLVVGLIGEFFADHKAKKYSWLKKHKRLFEVLVIAGVAGELIADGGIFSFGKHLQTISDRENSEMAVEVAQANLSAKKFDAARVESEKQIELLRSNNLALQLKLQPRMLNAEQKDRFLELVKTYPKIPIKVFCPSGDNEAYRYASQISEMLKISGFAAEDGQTIEVAGNFREWKDAPYTFNAVDICCFTWGTNKTTSRVLTPGILPDMNGNPILIGTNSISTFRCVMWAFDQIQIQSGFGENDSLLKPGEFGIFIPSKTH